MTINLSELESHAKKGEYFEAKTKTWASIGNVSSYARKLSSLTVKVDTVVEACLRKSFISMKENKVTVRCDKSLYEVIDRKRATYHDILVLMPRDRQGKEKKADSNCIVC